jgi:glucosylceramidase
MSETTRRGFFGLSTAGLIALAGESNASAETPGPIAVHQTAGTKRFTEEPPLGWHPKAETGSDAVVIDTAKMYQDVLGFGAALTDASASLINQLPSDAWEKFLHELFHPSELGIGVTRICIGSSDYSTEMFSYDEGNSDPELKRFSIDHDRRYVIP